ncbi:MAG: hypothetical protein JWM61_241 [Micrococcaceae bacterium]|jgi:hypothetical protein|uniref:DUF3515 domain-containing protein n=1 Tax=Arthrobacter sp. PL16 TaxID=3071720 RepID=UPI002E07A213|nr:hypothetical protein [Micrococcaceae bacterium]MEC5198239.1 hypothetical protein [Arthrobacter sp. PL16]
MRALPRAVALAAAAVTLLVVLPGCTSVVDVDPAEDAADASCADVMIALPPTVAENEQRDTNSQATSAWGDPSKVVLRCGVGVPGPTTDPCVTVNDVDWVVREGDPAWTATTYGRDPAVEVLFDPDEVASSTVLVELGDAVSRVEQTRACVGLSDATPAPPGG